VRCLARTPDGQRIATGGADGTVRLWAATTGRELLTLKGLSGTVMALAFDPDGGRLAALGTGGTAIVWDGRATGDGTD
jgi:WD40 repeat protein